MGLWAGHAGVLPLLPVALWWLCNKTDPADTCSAPLLIRLSFRAVPGAAQSPVFGAPMAASPLRPRQPSIHGAVMRRGGKIIISAVLVGVDALAGPALGAAHHQLLSGPVWPLHTQQNDSRMASQLGAGAAAGLHDVRMVLPRATALDVAACLACLALQHIACSAGHVAGACGARDGPSEVPPAETLLCTFTC